MAAKLCIVACTLAIARANSWYKTITPDENHWLCLDLPGENPWNGNMLWLWECNGHDSQKWVFDSYQIRYGGDENYCVDAREMQNGEQMMLWECNGMPQQTWGYDGDALRIYVMNTATCLDWWEGDSDNGQPLHVWDCNGHTNQQWDLWDAPDPGPSPPSPGPTPSPGNYVDSCSDQSGGDWPVFSDQNALESDGQWSTYFNLVYGSIPTFGYPICMSGFRMLHLQALSAAGLQISTGSGIGGFSHGEEYKSVSVGFIKHDNCQGQCFGDNTWFEGLHCSTSAETGSAWYYFATGSGVWLWSGHTGAWNNRKSFQSDMGYKHCTGHPKFECGGGLFSTAKANGYDTVQYIAEHLKQGGGSPMVIDTTGVGKYTCGNSQTPWRAGWAAQNDCDCDQSRTCQNCNGYSAPGCDAAETALLWQSVTKENGTALAEMVMAV